MSHITFTELKAVRYALESFLPYFVGRYVLMHEDNQAVVSVVTHMTTRSPQMMEELRKLWFLLDSNDVHLRPRYIRRAANLWADKLSRETDRDDWRFNPRLFAYINRQWGGTPWTASHRWRTYSCPDSMRGGETLKRRESTACT